jgi:hypothetical protein
MSNSAKRSGIRPATVVLTSLLAGIVIAVVCAATAKAADYKMVLCAANNGSNSFQTATNTAYSKYPSGIFSFENYCGPAPDPAGNNAFLRIRDIATEGTAAEGAYGSISWTVPPWVAILQAGGYTRQPSSFNQGWRARFWLEGFDGSTNNTLMQGSGVDNGSCGGVCWGTTSTFGSHVWPFTSLGNYRRFVFEVTCFRPAGCDRSGENIADANTMTLTLQDTSPVDLQLTNTSAPLYSGRWVRGNQTATYSWSDQGSGIRMEWIDIDGARRFTIDHANECNRDSSGPNGEFARNFQPCATASNIGRSYGFDSVSLPDGSHTLQACAQDYAQWQGLFGTGGASCRLATIRTDNTAPGAPAGLEVTSANPARYLPQFGARWQLPPNQGSPIAKAHYEVVNAGGEVVVPEQTVSATNPTALSKIEGPAKAGGYRLKLWLEDEVGFQGPATTAPIPHDTTPPAAPQGLQVTAPETSRAAQGFDVRWQGIQDAGSPIDAAHYQVLDGSGRVVVPTQTVEGDGVSTIEDLQTPDQPGPYTLRLWLSDEEGNVGAPATAPLSYRCVRSDAGEANMLSAGVGTEQGPEAIVRQGEGSILTGRLAERGDGVMGGPVCVFARVVTEGKREFLGIAMSRPMGGYSFALPAGPSREVSAVYRSGHREVSATATLQTVVHPLFEVRRKVVRNEGVAHFTGYIPGPDNDNVVVVLQVKRGKGWFAFRRYRTRDGGRFTVGYRFNSTTHPTLFMMRAQVRTQSGYPYLQGTSTPLRLVVLPARQRRR